MVCTQVFGNRGDGRLRRLAGPFRAQRVQAGDRQRCAAIGAPARPMPPKLSAYIASRASTPIARASRQLIDRSLMLVTALAPKIGYDNAAQDRQGGARQRDQLARRSAAPRHRQRRGVRRPGAAAAMLAPKRPIICVAFAETGHDVVMRLRLFLGWHSSGFAPCRAQKPGAFACSTVQAQDPFAEIGLHAPVDAVDAAHSRQKDGARLAARRQGEPETSAKQTRLVEQIEASECARKRRGNYRRRGA